MKKISILLTVVSASFLNAQNIAFDKLYGNNDQNNFYLGHYPVIGSDGLHIKWHGGIRLTTSNDSSILQLLGNGNVGIGTAFPVSKLDIKGDLALDGSNPVSPIIRGVTSSPNAGSLDFGDGTGWKFNFRRKSDAENLITFSDFGKVAIGGNIEKEKISIEGKHESTTFVMHANNDGNPHAYLTLWASEPQVSYHGVGIGNNVRNFDNNKAFTRITTAKGGSYMRLLENEVNINLISDAGDKKQAVTVTASGVNVQGKVIAENDGLYSARSIDIGGSLSLINHLKTGDQSSNWTIYNMTGAYGNSLQFWSYSTDGTKNVSRLKLGDEGDMALFGKFEAKEVKVTITPTADFVFEEDYALPKLEDVEKHIKQKKHLPEISSAKEMKKEGLNIGEFQIKLLQKIEELTLYSIEQNKKINQLLESEINNKSEIQELKNLIHNK